MSPDEQSASSAQRAGASGEFGPQFRQLVRKRGKQHAGGDMLLVTAARALPKALPEKLRVACEGCLQEKRRGPMLGHCTRKHFAHAAAMTCTASAVELRAWPC